MNKYLKSASERFEKIKEKDYAISPMSEVDCEIVVELSQLLSKMGKKDVVEILKNYKYLKDEEVRDQLLQCNIDEGGKAAEQGDTEVGKLLQQIDKLKEKLANKEKFIVLQDDKISSRMIFGYSVSRDYEVTGRLQVR